MQKAGVLLTCFLCLACASRVGYKEEITCDSDTESHADTNSSAATKFVFFDFDQTISTIHAFKFLGGYWASTECGQIRAILELNNYQWNCVPGQPNCQPCQQKCEGHFSTAALGGSERVGHLKALFEDLKKKGNTLVVITRGYVGSVRKILADTQLLSFFTHVYGNIGDGYQGWPRLAFDTLCHPLLASLPDSAMHQGKQQDSNNNKQPVIAGLMKEHKLNKNQVLFVDDSKGEIDKVGEQCLKIEVKARTGITEEHIKQIQACAANSESKDCLEALS